MVPGQRRILEGEQAWKNETILRGNFEICLLSRALAKP